jgi:hypothetical protein
VIDKLQSHCLTRTPFGRAVAPGMCTAISHAEAVARIGWCVTERALGEPCARPWSDSRPVSLDDVSAATAPDSWITTGSTRPPRRAMVECGLVDQEPEPPALERLQRRAELGPSATSRSTSGSTRDLSSRPAAAGPQWATSTAIGEDADAGTARLQEIKLM